MMYISLSVGLTFGYMVDSKYCFYSLSNLHGFKVDIERWSIFGKIGISLNFFYADLILYNQVTGFVNESPS